ncbi:MAG: 16S rRNA (cytosine(1402)-N(4))-methyltransferase RsmH [Erysipelotrichaceae bacterium]|nr:16S rRNA (cytosine(1402)-N(4))-methyltransferase RsmH [Erysipelotrichaceae bacterium]
MMEHQSVLLTECITNLAIKTDGIYVDGTLGRGGHSKEILKYLSKGHLYCFDKDKTAIAESRSILSSVSGNFTMINQDFRNMNTVLKEFGINKIDGVLLDLGVSSPQFDDLDRGFSYRFDALLDMRMDLDQSLSAYEVVNNYSKEKLAELIYRYGEERYSRQIANQIEKARLIKPITTTLELVEIIKSALPNKVLQKKGHPAKQTFQAIRIEVNKELEALQEGLKAAIEMLNEDGRICVIAFHSLEDRIVKELFREYCDVDRLDRRIPINPQDIEVAKYELVTKKPIVASAQEIAINNRSRSAKLRVLRKR